MHRYFVKSNEQLTRTTILVTLSKDPQQTNPFLFRPGQYAAINFWRHGRPTAARCFSIVSSPYDTNTLQFSMRSKGRYTKALSALEVGSVVDVRGPFGAFVLDEQHDDAVLLAGGIGITPFMSMVRAASEQQSQKTITLLYSCQTQDDVPFADELQKLTNSNNNLRVIFIIGKGPTDLFANAMRVSGRITSELIDNTCAQNIENKTFYICGPPSFMKGMQHILASKNIPKSHVMTEAFSQGPNQQTGKLNSWPANMYALGALGLAVGTLVVMVSDVLKALPVSSVLSPTSTVRLTKLTNSRQTDLDTLVNALPSLNSNAPETPAVTQALKAANSTSVQTNTSSAKPATTTSSAPAAPVTPAPAPAPKCSTTQSGVTTCV